MNRQSVLNMMFESKIIPLFYNGDKTIARKLVDACAAGGALVIEFTDRGDHAEEVFEDLINYSKEHHPNLALGVGSIATAEQAERFIAKGAHFLVSPFLDKSVAEVCAKYDMLWTGGSATLTEMHTAHSWGVPLMKAFPGNLLGPDFIKAAKAPCPWLNIMPTGGVQPNEENLRSWFDAGASCVGMGSKLFVKDADGNFEFDRITELLKESIKIARQ